MTAQYGFCVDSTRCVKCYACEVACQQWHEIKAATVHRRIVQEECTGTFPAVTRRFTSLSCMHCENPLCVASCGQGAISKREEDGIVVVDKEKCILDKSCLEACPFDVPQFDDVSMNKCDACLSLDRKEDEMPRCVNTCPTKALTFGKLEDLAAHAAEKGGKQMEGSTVPSVYLI